RPGSRRVRRPERWHGSPAATRTWTTWSGQNRPARRPPGVLPLMHANADRTRRRSPTSVTLRRYEVMKRGELIGSIARPAGARRAGPLRLTLLAVLVASAGSACSGDDGAGPGGDGGEQVAVSIQPTSAELETGASETFTATVTGTSNTGVTWQASCGSVAGQGATVTYTAPSEPGDCTLTATSQADQTKS